MSGAVPRRPAGPLLLRGNGCRSPISPRKRRLRMSTVATRLTAPRPTTGNAPSHSPPDTLYAPGNSLARGLGWFSIALGLTEIVAHDHLSQAIGVDDHPLLLPLLGVREVMSGIGILAEKRPTEWMWSRVCGDAM